MNGLQRAGTHRCSRRGTFAVVALLSHATIAFAQVTGSIPVKTTGTSEIIILRSGTSPLIDSLSKRRNSLPVGSPEFFAVDSSLQVAIAALPRQVFSAQVAPSRAPLRATQLADIVPVGWFGFTADGAQTSWYEPTGMVLRYYEYPTVVAVELNSPASRVGIRSGDSLVAYDGIDLRRNPINLTRLLTPGRDVSIRLRRDGEAKDVLISVERAPADLLVERRAGAAAATMLSIPRTPSAPDAGADRRLVEARAGAEGRNGSMGPVAQRSPTQVIVNGVAAATSMPSGVLGAAIRNIDEEMSKSIVGMEGKRGILITTVPLGSPADRNGLKALDVILRVDDGEVANTGALRARLMLADATHADKIRLLILRAGKTRELTIDANR